MLNTKIIVPSLLLLAAILICSKACSYSKALDLREMYTLYKQEYMSPDGRIMDPKNSDYTTSEGQAYMLIQSLLEEDRDTFDLVYSWTCNNLRRSDNLFSWNWGKNSEGKYGIIDINSASDADVDIAFSLLIAYQTWHDEKYLKYARKIIDSIWDNETKSIDNHIVLMPGVTQMSNPTLELNPSYFSTYAFKLFQLYDKSHNWDKVVDSSYYYLNVSMSKTKTGLPPNWFLIQDSKVKLEDSVRSDFSYDAVRVFPRIYLDYIMTGDQRALQILGNANFFVKNWKDTQNIYVNYKHTGMIRDKDKFVGSIAVLIPAIGVCDKDVASQIYQQEVLPYLNNAYYWSKRQDYYGKNLLFFGVYLYGMKLQDE